MYLKLGFPCPCYRWCKEVEGQPLIAPRWSFCLSYELEIRKEAIRLCKEESYGIQSALWTTLKNTEHRMKHWLQLVAIPKCSLFTNFPGIADAQKRISDLEKARSRSPRRSAQKQKRFPLVLRCCLFLPPLRRLRVPKEAKGRAIGEKQRDLANLERLLSRPTTRISITP